MNPRFSPTRRRRASRLPARATRSAAYGWDRLMAGDWPPGALARLLADLADPAPPRAGAARYWST